MASTLAPLYLIDGHSLTFKAYYGVRGLTSPEGKPTGAVFGFLRMLLKFLDDYTPEYVAIVFDAGRKTFRNDLYPEYKATRDEAPRDFSDQMDHINRLLAAMGFAVYCQEGFEADDLIATMAEGAKTTGRPVVILSADKDMFQLIDDRVTMLRPGRDDLVRYGPDQVRARMGVGPERVVDWLALVGDASDNVPGVPGIGEKSAGKLIEAYGDLESLLARAEEIKNARQRNGLLENPDRARLALQLVTIRRDVPLAWSVDACRMPDDPWNDAVVTHALELGFQSILKERAIEIKTSVAERVEAAAAPDVETHYETIRDSARLEAWVAEALKAPRVALDTETTGTDARRDELVGISLSHRAGHAVYLPVGHRPEAAGGDQVPLETVRHLLAPLLGPGGPPLVGHHAKFDWKVLRTAGFHPAPAALDTMIMSFLLDPDKAGGHGLKALGRELLGVTMAPITELIGSGRSQITMAEVAVEDAAPYACLDADATLRLAEVLEPRLQQTPVLLKLLKEMEMPLAEVLMAMELGGFRLDVAALRELSAEVKRRRDEVCKRIWEEAGHPFNIGSPKQVAALLYDELGLPTGRKGKTGYSTAEAEMERLAPLHPIPRLILEYREYEKLESTYIDSLPGLVDPHTGRIHTSFNQTIASTGRLSSTDPNLQNIPIRTELGRAIRRGFVADNESHLLLKADYSQIELRILAHVSEDAALSAAYHEGRDIHTQTASEVFGLDPGDVSGSQRSQAKAINFGIVYGMSPHGLAMQLGISRSEAAAFIDRYFNTYPGVRAWIERTLEHGRREGWVETLLGRRRLTPGLRENNRQLRMAAERVAVNTPIQGTCADMIKLAMIRIHAGLPAQAPGARMVCQVHDELVFTVPRDLIQQTGDWVKQQMEGAMTLNVPVVVDVSTAPNWAEC